MYRKLEEEKLKQLLEAGIEEFSKHGLDRANINVIAKKAGVSVGVLYKYYQDKDNFFLSCVRHSLELLDATIKDALRQEDDIKTSVEKIVYALVRHSQEHSNYYVMYNEITSGSCNKYAIQLANEIEGRTGLLYAELLRKAQEEGSVKTKGDPRMFAFFFDNLLMMLQFSFSCDYYKERLKIFCGEECLENKEELAKEFVTFMMGALGTKE